MDEEEEFEETGITLEEQLKQAEVQGLKNAKKIGVLASQAWDALENGDLARASTLYEVIGQFSQVLANTSHYLFIAEINRQNGDDA
ncbi:MAG: hypothetical protein ACQ5SW_09600 [Sphaerochaetaceae bacterium]